MQCSKVLAWVTAALRWRPPPGEFEWAAPPGRLKPAFSTQALAECPASTPQLCKQEERTGRRRQATARAAWSLLGSCGLGGAGPGCSSHYNTPEGSAGREPGLCPRNAAMPRSESADKGSFVKCCQSAGQSLQRRVAAHRMRQENSKWSRRANRAAFVCGEERGCRRMGRRRRLQAPGCVPSPARQRGQHTVRALHLPFILKHPTSGPRPDQRTRSTCSHEWKIVGGSSRRWGARIKRCACAPKQAASGVVLEELHGEPVEGNGGNGDGHRQRDEQLVVAVGMHRRQPGVRQGRQQRRHLRGGKGQGQASGRGRRTGSGIDSCLYYRRNCTARCSAGAACAAAERRAVEPHCLQLTTMAKTPRTRLAAPPTIKSSLQQHVTSKF